MAFRIFIITGHWVPPHQNSSSLQSTQRQKILLIVCTCQFGGLHAILGVLYEMFSSNFKTKFGILVAFFFFQNFGCALGFDQKTFHAKHSQQLQKFSKIMTNKTRFPRLDHIARLWSYKAIQPLPSSTFLHFPFYHIHEILVNNPGITSI